MNRASDRVSDHGSPARWFCISPGGSWAWGGDLVPLYGENAPQGWACTGPLIERFGLCIASPDNDNVQWIAFDYKEAPGTGARADNACAAVAEWVAEHVENGEVRP
jgi:hypothetical protein